METFSIKNVSCVYFILIGSIEKTDNATLAYFVAYNFRLVVALRRS